MTFAGVPDAGLLVLRARRMGDLAVTSSASRCAMITGELVYGGLERLRLYRPGQPAARRPLEEVVLPVCTPVEAWNKPRLV